MIVNSEDYRNSPGGIQSRALRRVVFLRSELTDGLIISNKYTKIRQKKKGEK